jgi:hypothetical protein
LKGLFLLASTHISPVGTAYLRIYSAYLSYLGKMSIDIFP